MEPWQKNPLLEKRSKVRSSVSKSQVCFFARSNKGFMIIPVPYSFPVVLHCPMEAFAELQLNRPSTASPTWMTNNPLPTPIIKSLSLFQKRHKGVFQIWQLQRNALNRVRRNSWTHANPAVHYHDEVTFELETKKWNFLSAQMQNWLCSYTYIIQYCQIQKTRSGKKKNNPQFPFRFHTYF